ncbi:hypothetical protein F0562_004262 [Nyssa sinensis]|uniref:Trichome birefringence-like N-terminal domain-containing protein n=1 Tax=Nyssa sinensis TaxID=561372 RepID=A0A5J5BXD2_9ASTE|nr:hypothetical protein F0562_004262 [Nyssa sinensis]
MKVNAFEFPSGKNTPLSSCKNAILPILTLTLLTSLPLYLYNNSPSPLQSVEIHDNNASIPLYQKNNSTSPLQSVEIHDNNASIPLYQKNNSTLPLQSVEIHDNNGSIPLYQKNNSTSPLQSPGNGITSNDSASIKKQSCNLFRGNWVLDTKGPYYTNETKCVIDDRQNCMKFGRPDTEFLKWRWKPDECELPLFDAGQFLELVRGKTLAFVGDSVGRNQMQSLVCLLASVASPVDVSYVPDTRFRRWLYPDYNFTMAALWSPLLTKVREADDAGNFSRTSLMNLYLDEADEAWTAHIEDVDIVVISAGQWFLRPFIYYENGSISGCRLCHKENITDLSIFYGYRMAFRTVFRTLLNLKNYKGLTFLRTFSPAHFENGDWDKGGNCGRQRPFTKQEMKLDGYTLELYRTQVEEFRAAEREGRKRGLKWRLLDTSEAMVLRADGHPNHYGHWSNGNKTTADCVHWCLPGPVDTWNEFLLQILKMEGEGEGKGEGEGSSIDGKLEKNFR